MKKVYIYPYKMGSQSASNLANYLDVYQIKHKRSKFVPNNSRTIINWGSGSLPSLFLKCRIVNKPDIVNGSSNKLSLFQRLKDRNDIRFVPWTTSYEEAKSWLEKNKIVVARKSLTSHSGYGIVIVELNQELPKCQLYTQYISKDSEWRIHIMDGEIIFQQRKIKDPEIKEPKSWKIRSHDNGFIFQHNGLVVPEDVKVQALAVMASSGLEFGAVDVIYNRKQNRAYILEINTAPGLEGETVKMYGEAFKKYLRKENVQR